MPREKKERLLEGVVVKLSEVNRYVVGKDCYIAFCVCLKKELYLYNNTDPEFTYTPGSEALCPVCGYYTWHKTEEGLPRGGTFYPKNPTC